MFQITKTIQPKYILDYIIQNIFID